MKSTRSEGRGRIWGVAAAAMLVLSSTACGGDTGDGVEGGDLSDRPPEDLLEWDTPENLGPDVNSEFNERFPAVSPDELTLYFQSDRPGGCGGHDIWVSRRTSIDDRGWQPPQNLGCRLNPSAEDSAYELGFALSSHRSALYFNSSRPGGLGGEDLYLTTRKMIGSGETSAPTRTSGRNKTRHVYQGLHRFPPLFKRDCANPQAPGDS